MIEKKSFALTIIMYNGKVAGEFVADIVMDVGLLLNSGEGKVEVKEKCRYILLAKIEVL